jgi:hypothetical protein
MNSLRLADPNESWAVLAGVPHYKNLMDIPQVSNNIAALGAVLGNTRIWGLPASRTDIVKPENVRDEFITKAGEAAQKATDTLIVYYAGHGLPDPQSGELYLGLPGTEKGYVDTALRYEFLARRLTDPQKTVRNTVVILDCCFSGRAVLSGRMSAGEEFVELADIPGACLLAASAPNRTASAPLGETYTSFTGALLDILQQGAVSSDRLLSVTTLHYHTFRRLSKVQAPELRTRGSGDRVCFAKNVGYVPTAQATKVPETPAASTQSATTLVRQRLEYVRRVKGFELVEPGHESKLVAKARQSHALGADEELIGVWQFRSNLLRPPDSLIFTSHGVRIADGKRKIFIPYTKIRQYGFSCQRTSSQRASGSTAITVSVYFLKASGPGESWSSPFFRSSAYIEDVVILLGDIQQMPIRNEK